MEDQTKDVKIKEEQRKIKEKIQAISDSKVFYDIQRVLSKYNNNILDKTGICSIRLEGRVKKEKSAIDKIEKKCVSADEIYDLIGFMIVVELPEEYEKVSKLKKKLLPEFSFIHEFNGKSPENNGYSGLHMGVNVKQLLDENGVKNNYVGDDSLQTEIQLKSYGMYIAQEVTHDSIYKNKNLSGEQKDRMQSVMFPLVEKLSDIEKYQERLEICFDEQEKSFLQRRIEEVKQEVFQHKMENRQFIEDNITDVENILKEYVVVKYVEKFRQDPDLSITREKIGQISEQCRNATLYLSNNFEPEIISDTEPTGFKNIDKLLNEIQEKTIDQIQELNNRSQENEALNLLQGVIQVSETQVTSEDIRAMASSVNKKTKMLDQQTYDSSKKQENREVIIDD